ncbi:uncharacterized mitochondrial protein AtMg00810-like [Lycium barbarum]|uniref:uncharacterized mitochondrial protein AtMg00810-like n=1 Tax=Lycium barbarum TaxID=112863 RepID=UPI00293EB164|nr:uncharacterized mitochondrial protein AtMg00810-like [Lycium barbarum]
MGMAVSVGDKGRWKRQGEQERMGEMRERKCDNSLFIYRKGTDMAYILLYVDDIILTASSNALHLSIKGLLSSEFAMKDLGPLNYFLGIAVSRHKGGMFLSQRKYAEQIIERAGMSSCKSSPTPVDTKEKVSATSSATYEDPTLYRSLAGGSTVSYIHPTGYFLCCSTSVLTYA